MMTKMTTMMMMMMMMIKTDVCSISTPRSFVDKQFTENNLILLTVFPFMFTGSLPFGSGIIFFFILAHSVYKM